MKTTKIMTLIGWAISATTAGYLLPKFLITSGSTVPISPWNIIITLPVIGIILVLIAMPMIRYRKALLLRAQDLSKPRPTPTNPFYAVRLVLLAKAVAISGAIFAGWHLGVVWLQLTLPIIPTSTLQNGLALFGAAIMIGCAILVERICRITDDGNTSEDKDIAGEPA